MQIKTINKVLRDKMEEWLKSIRDEGLRSDLRDNFLVSGGSIASLLLREPVNDYDVYIKDIDVLKKLAIYYTKDNSDIRVFDGRQKRNIVEEYNSSTSFSCEDPKNWAREAVAIRNLKEDQIKLDFYSSTGGLRVNEGVKEEEMNYTPLYFSPNAISLSNQVQVVLRFWGDNEQIHKTFDYIHATNYFTMKDGVVTNTAALESLITKQLRYQGSLYPVTSIIRAKKFIKRGFNVSAGDLVKIMFQISELDMSNPDVLEEQLIGVDVAYFDMLIQALREKYSSDPEFKLSSEYFSVLVDKIFNETEDLDNTNQ